jgi:hypothetical protein
MRYTAPYHLSAYTRPGCLPALRPGPMNAATTCRIFTASLASPECASSP